MPTPIKFGTDGWRAIIAEDYTFENVRICAQAVAQFLRDTGGAERGLVVGYDTRFASEDFAAAVAEVVAANDIKVYLCDQACPTPAVSFSILGRRAGGAVIITASHNPAAYNGFKYKPEYAGSASPEVVAQLEQRIEAIQNGGQVKRIPLDQAKAAERVELIDPRRPYLDHLANLVDLEPIRQAGLRVAVDSMFGAGAGYLKDLVDGGRTEVIELNGERNPSFPGVAPEPITRNLGRLAALIREDPSISIGLATDGDADRVGAMDERGNFIDQLQTFALLALYLLEVRGHRGALVKSVTTTSMTYRLGELYNVPVYETPVGFKYIGPVMMEHDALIGGEESGGFGFRGHIPERDGVLSALYLLDFVVKTGKTPSQLIEYLYQKVGGHYYDRIDLHFPADQRAAIVERLRAARPTEIDGTPVTPEVMDDGFRFVFADGGWLLIRFSGTEPVMRIYTETNSVDRVQRILAAGRELAGV